VLRSSTLIALLFSARALMAVDPTLPEYVPPDTRMLIGVQVRAIMDSDWGKAVIEQVKTTYGDAWLKEAPFKGFDPLKDLDELWIASSSVDQKAPRWPSCAAGSTNRGSRLRPADTTQCRSSRWTPSGNSWWPSWIQPPSWPATASSWNGRLTGRD